MFRSVVSRAADHPLLIRVAAKFLFRTHMLFCSGLRIDVAEYTGMNAIVFGHHSLLERTLRKGGAMRMPALGEPNRSDLRAAIAYQRAAMAVASRALLSTASAWPAAGFSRSISSLTQTRN